MRLNGEVKVIWASADGYVGHFRGTIGILRKKQVLVEGVVFVLMINKAK